MATVHHWTGLEAKALRLALRLSVRAFAEHLGVGVRTVSKWEKLRASTEPRPDTQAILDTALARADVAVHLRFETFLSEVGRPGEEAAGLRVTSVAPLSWEYESWADDLDRVVVALSQQDFPFADNLLHRWLSRFKMPQLDEKGRYLFARSTALLGDLKRYQGTLVGLLSAQHCYIGARAVFTQLDIPRRAAQLDLSLAIVMEMSGKLETAARAYEALAVDSRLSACDRARARLWVGTALSKEGWHDYATRAMTAATHAFEDLAEPDDWSVAHQKLALARRGAGDLTTALRYLDVAFTTGNARSPMQRVQLTTAQAHILCTDPATRDDGLRLLDEAAQIAARSDLGHQLRSIEAIRRTCEGAFKPPHHRPGSCEWQTDDRRESPRISGKPRS
ncbi:helix-turn-helix domain-containing protein [Streptomyces sp. NPDC127069]|uniref:helix-turn-helix domain-containing protein n=1 Tax=Streptomyces sp. NPDC127069 TaxID=3347128 RepID=UPI003663DFAF